MASVSTRTFLKLRLYTKSRLFNEKFNFHHKISFLKSTLYVKSRSRSVKLRLYCIRHFRDMVASLNVQENDLVNTEDFDDPLIGADKLEEISGLDRIAKEDCYAVLASLLDGSRFAEFKKRFGGNLIAGFGFLEGRLIGLLINCGAPITGADAQKGAHFIHLCDSRDIPIVFLQNGANNEVVVGDESALTIKERAKMAQSLAVCRVPKISVNIGGVFGDEHLTMCGQSFDPSFYFMWPRAEMSKWKEDEFNNAFLTAEESDEGKKRRKWPVEAAQFWVSRNVSDGIVLPSNTRKTLSKCLYLAMLNFERNPAIRGQQKTVVRI